MYYYEYSTYSETKRNRGSLVCLAKSAVKSATPYPVARSPWKQFIFLTLKHLLKSINIHFIQV